MHIMHGDLWLDCSYDSGLENRPGARFVIQLNEEPIDVEAILKNNFGSNERLDSFVIESRGKCSLESEETAKEEQVLSLVERKMEADKFSSTVDLEAGEFTSLQPTEEPRAFSSASMPSRNHRDNLSINDSNSLREPKCARKSGTKESRVFPENLSVLFVDDDAILRRLFIRAVQRVAPHSWQIKGASSGEMALKLCETEQFDIIFLDQYMASVDKQLLGTETAQAMRNIGIKAKICGLSANDLRDVFINAGANDFVLKPMPCTPKDVTHLLERLLFPTMASANVIDIAEMRRSGNLSTGDPSRSFRTGEKRRNSSKQLSTETENS